MPLSVFTFALSFSSLSSAQDIIPAEPLVIDEAEALAMDAQKYSESYGTSFDESLRRLTIMLYGSPEIATTASTEGQDLAGTYFDNSSDFSVVVKSKNPKESRFLNVTPKTKINYGQLNSVAKQLRNEARKALRSKLSLNNSQITKAEGALSKSHQLKVKFQKAEVTLDDLNSAMVALVNNGSKIEGFNSAFINERNSTINIILDREISIDAQTKLRTISKVPVTFEVISNGMQLVANMKGGANLYASSNSDSTSNRECMSAFGAQHNTAKTATGSPVTGLITAAHCISNLYILGSDLKNYPLSIGQQNIDPLKSDLRFTYNVNDNPIGVGEFYYDSSFTVRKVTGTRSRLETRIAQGTTTGAFVCHVGQVYSGSPTNIQSCGEVISLNGYMKGNALQGSGGYYVVMRNTQSGGGTTHTSGTGTLRCYKGDSGGPVFAGTIAFGVMKSCTWVSGEQSTPTTYAMYTSIDYIKDIGASIIVP